MHKFAQTFSMSVYGYMYKSNYFQKNFKKFLIF